MGEIGSHATIFELEGLGSEKRTYIKWLLTQSAAPKTKTEGTIHRRRFSYPSQKLSTPLQFEFYLTRALEELTRLVRNRWELTDMIDSVLAKNLTGLA